MQFCVRTSLLFVVSWLAFCPCCTALAADSPLELVVQTGHTERIVSVFLSDDGRLALTGSQDGSAILWDVITGQQLRTFGGNNESVNCVALSGDGRRVFTAAYDKEAILWDAITGQKLRTFRGHTDVVMCVAISADGKRVVTGASDKEAILWDAITGQKVFAFRGHTEDVKFVALIDSGRRVLTGSTDGAVILWDALTGKQLKSFGTSSVNWVKSAAFTGDGRHLRAAYGGQLSIWNVATGEILAAYQDNNSDAAALSADARHWLTGSFDGSATLWDATTGKKMKIFAGHSDTVTAVCLSLDGRLIFTASRDKTAILWDVSTGQKRLTVMARTASVNSVSLSGNNQRALVGSGDNTASLWDASTGRKLHTFVGHTQCINSVALSRDGQRAVTGSEDKTAILWDASIGTKLRDFQGHTDALRSVALSGDGRYTLTGSIDKTAVLWNTSTGQKLQLYRGHAGEVLSVALSSDGARVLTGSADKTATLWNPSTGKKLRDFQGQTIPVFSVGLSSDGSRVLIGAGGKSPTLWDANTGRQLRTLQEHTGRVSVVALSSDGQRVLAGSEGNTAILWNASTGQKLQTFEGHTSWITSVAFGGSEGRILTGSGDGTARLWDTASGKEVCRLISLDAGKDWLVVTPDGLFDGSIDAAKFVSYRLRGTLEFAPLERFQQKYYQPGLLAMLMKGERPRAKVDIGKSLPPKVRITSPTGAGLNASRGTLEVQAVAETRGEQPVTSFKLLLDGRPYGGQNAVFHVANPKLGAVTARWSIELEPGRHTLKVFADTTYVQGASDEIDVRYLGGQSETKEELPSLSVLAIGISKYPGTRKLDYAAADAQALAEAYQQNSRRLFANMEVKLVTDEQATHKGIFQGLQWLRERLRQEKDFGVIYFAGHGEPQDGSLYFLPIDFEEKNLAGSSIDAGVLKKQLLGIGKGKLMLILDTCHSGAIGSGKTRDGGSPHDRLIRDMTAEENGLIVMCSAMGNEKAQESHAHRHGMFTVGLLEGLAGRAKKDTDGLVFFTALDAYVVERVRELSKGQQHAVNSKPTTVRDFPVSKP